MITQIIGGIGATLTTIALLPQVIKAWKTKKTEDISLLTTIILTIGVSLWIIYGVLIGEPIVWLANVITFFIVVSLLLLKVKYG